jgi:hypothetical protein
MKNDEEDGNEDGRFEEEESKENSTQLIDQYQEFLKSRDR